MQARLRWSNPVIGSTQVLQDGEVYSDVQSQPTFEHVDMCGYCYIPVTYCTPRNMGAGIEDGEECDDGEVDLGRH